MLSLILDIKLFFKLSKYIHIMELTYIDRKVIFKRLIEQTS